MSQGTLISILMLFGSSCTLHTINRDILTTIKDIPPVNASLPSVLPNTDLSDDTPDIPKPSSINVGRGQHHSFNGNSMHQNEIAQEKGLTSETASKPTHLQSATIPKTIDPFEFLLRGPISSTQGIIDPLRMFDRDQLLLMKKVSLGESSSAHGAHTAKTGTVEPIDFLNNDQQWPMKGSSDLLRRIKSPIAEMPNTFLPKENSSNSIIGQSKLVPIEINKTWPFTIVGESVALGPNAVPMPGGVHTKGTVNDILSNIPKLFGKNRRHSVTSNNFRLFQFN
ncbi:hypothetical protein DPMN_065456 [Dreissena polymorpha]|uniref:Uncharacterized protein n=1 Tax=Dreissena polymorpha TaxID=45954 RepID=A0A9D3YWI7_DREPO|nr:hypothetical protein DPMN_065456 [Dreissena polymorpha]